MNIHVERGNQHFSYVPEDAFFVSFLQHAVEQMKDKVPSDKTYIGVVLLGEEQMSIYNNLHRDMQEATDVLAYPSDDDLPEELGEMMLCPPVIRQELSKHASDHEMERAIGERLAHGFLHLLGYDHLHIDDWEDEEGELRGKEMAAATDCILDSYWT